ncbi:DSBA oxidoreductase [Xylanimonas cellulosilytica DSM 15894]|uniref:DSBA oxidoreductase n=1 Tax=Xylanimonas cellulosilytica (strain DSM 15894 / JCM 12276 / CECT 5975 / KCTC 9989 / LMG 20990 / NBRC 107835 / XIL07) TaxID=446471 RepID=D1BZ56_XYLCX|nr:DsbA family protein [Xylanimonas cellulosilytica]ACZ31953.1 DSBA oxidoreductase [Xylanimonas cellulosilytica DSM 15894]
MSSNSQNQSKAQRREAARAQALELKRKQEAADKRARLITMSVLGVVLAALVAIVAFLLIRDSATNAADAVDDGLPLSEVTDVPATALADGGIPIGAGGVAGVALDEDLPTVGVFFDYLCPICGQFEEANEDTLEGFLADGTANVVLYPVSILNRFSQGTEYPTRAAAAFAWVADRAPAQALAFHKALFANEPEENTPGHANEQIAEFAREVGVPSDVADGIASGEARRVFGQWVTSATGAATSNEALLNAQGQFGTPTITIDGERWEGNWMVPGALAQAVADATP